MRQSLILVSALVACGDDGANTPDATTQPIDAAIDATVDARPTALGVLFINEVMPSNTTACMDIVGEFDDFIELYNSGAAAIDLGGFTISDDQTVPAKATLAAGVTVPAHGYRMLWADGQIQGLDHLPFKLNANGEEITLYAPDGTMLDTYSWTIAMPDQSFARFPDGSGGFATCAAASCGVTNGTGCAIAREVTR